MVSKVNEEIKEDLNDDGAQWGVVIPRSDISFAGSGPEVKNRPPFAREVKNYMDNVMIDAVNILVDEFKIRSLSKVSESVDIIYRQLHQDGRMPPIGDISTHRHPEGLYVILKFGLGYMVPFEWTDFNDYIETVSKRYKTSGKEEIRSIIKEIALPATKDS